MREYRCGWRSIIVGLQEEAQKDRKVSAAMGKHICLIEHGLKWLTEHRLIKMIDVSHSSVLVPDLFRMGTAETADYLNAHARKDDSMEKMLTGDTDVSKELNSMNWLIESLKCDGKEDKTVQSVFDRVVLMLMLRLHSLVHDRKLVLRGIGVESTVALIYRLGVMKLLQDITNWTEKCHRNEEAQIEKFITEV